MQRSLCVKSRDWPHAECAEDRNFAELLAILIDLVSLFISKNSIGRLEQPASTIDRRLPVTPAIVDQFDILPRLCYRGHSLERYISNAVIMIQVIDTCAWHSAFWVFRIISISSHDRTKEIRPNCALSSNGDRRRNFRMARVWSICLTESVGWGGSVSTKL